MDNKLYRLNTLFAIVDTLVSLLAIAAFSMGAYLFDRWWIVCFNLIPLILFHSHTLIINSDISAAEEEEVKQDER
mgnify:CR=1 FL=1